jgi:hypothetical protein
MSHEVAVMGTWQPLSSQGIIKPKLREAMGGRKPGWPVVRLLVCVPYALHGIAEAFRMCSFEHSIRIANIEE